jgi:UDP-N-acetylglucosamine 4-epimerase
MSYYIQVKNELLKKPRTWLVTGVAGFIGNHLLEALLSLNQRVIGLDNFATSTQNDLNRTLALFKPAQQKLFSFHEGDILSPKICAAVMENVDIVLHQAAMASVPLSIKEPAMVHAVNNTGFLNILLAAKNAHVKRIIYASSCAVYGDTQQMPIKESSPFSPLSPYAATKACNEIDASAFAKTYGLETIGLRYFNVFGPHQSLAGAYAAVIPAWIDAIKNNQAIQINGDGENSRDFCYVKDIVKANILAGATQEKTALNTVYNVGSGVETSLNKLCDFIKIAFKKENHPVQYNAERQGDIRHSKASIEKIQSSLQYEATQISADLLTPEAMQIPFVQ